MDQTMTVSALSRKTDPRVRRVRHPKCLVERHVPKGRDRGAHRDDALRHHRLWHGMCQRRRKCEPALGGGLGLWHGDPGLGLFGGTPQWRADQLRRDPVLGLGWSSALVPRTRELVGSLGSLLGAALLCAVFPCSQDMTGMTLGTNVINDNYGWGNVLVGELLCSTSRIVLHLRQICWIRFMNLA